MRTMWLCLATVALAACGGSSKPKPTAPASPEPAPASPEPAPPDDEGASLSDITGDDDDAAPDGAFTVRTGIIECDEYMARAWACFQSDKFPESARQAVRDAFQQMSQAWRDLANAPPEARRAAADACVQAMDAMRQGAHEMCPGVF